MAAANAHPTKGLDIRRLWCGFIVRSLSFPFALRTRTHLLIGLSGCIASIMRLVYSIQNLNSGDPNYDLEPVALWTYVNTSNPHTLFRESNSQLQVRRSCKWHSLRLSSCTPTVLSSICPNAGLQNFLISQKRVTNLHLKEVPQSFEHSQSSIVGRSM